MQPTMQPQPLLEAREWLKSQNPIQLTRAVNVPAVRHRVTAILVTHNQCPFAANSGRLADNPLTWALDSLLAQAGEALREIIVVDDGSTDHTPTIVEAYRYMLASTERSIRLISLRHRRRRGLGAGRNTGIAQASGDLILFGDDDAVFRPHCVTGAAYTLMLLRDHDPRACALALPSYDRSLWPQQIAELAYIGRLEPENARFSARFDCYPTEYLREPQFLDHDSGLLAPFPVELMNGTCLVDAATLRHAGGFPDLSSWPAASPEHLYLAVALTRAGGHLYHMPDPRLAARTDDSARRQTPSSLADLIGSYFAFFVAASHRGAVAWGIRSHQEFVVSGVSELLRADQMPPSERRRQWRDGLRRGTRFAADNPPRVSAMDLQNILDEITRAVREPRIALW
jgi:GT2 family glycosyltransferase